ncbi:uncharacterized protein LOC129568842 [Sitodiplosis mosellana]|uniref:uncharacterized protein LOC129568842 n=1 Tax=Sitodiplosis mosellana TaxID=263140 RepID=UPI00244487F6|nr:uncharacterized protein LOC129568842 [Sitodiplosis mosellana]
MTEESATLPPPPAPPLNQPKQRLNPHEIRNVDLVQRFLAATPSYLYSPPPIGPPNFFFSEMLRSLVQSKAAEGARGLQNPMRRPRKRLWTPPNRFENESLSKEPTGEKPLELTTKHQAIPFPSAFNPHLKSPKESDKSAAPEVSIASSNEPTDSKLTSYPTGETTVNEPSAASLPPSDLVMPQIPPIWYPPLYPPYGIDPLHFFIDLRVSGQLYDRKKENSSPSAEINSLTSENNNISKARHGSAFSVPPRRDKSPLALNLSSIGTKPNSIDFANNNFTEIDDKSKNTNYVLQNLPRIYTSLTHNPDDRHSEESESKSSSDIDVKDHEQISNFSDDVVIVDQDPDGPPERKHFKRK